MGDRELRMALWRGSTTSGNLTRTGRATMMLVHGGGGYYLRLTVRRGADLEVEGTPRAHFVATVEDVQQDVVSYAELTSGVTFRLPHPEAVLPRWQATVDALRAASSPRPADEL